ncbi:kelch-like protein 8 [Biomphalaria pfeifferi]|uniref:Kelch-like protein 8 n=1 Tax=Biomphalaria pfeifferi TaxID=112525 RepID=A0AAD8AUI4_BIOPF|nr:kelch-like protein 8 [Biomphalaria pfeifferi]
MKEKLEMKVDLPSISFKTFQLILEILYTGCDLLTKDNVLEVWAAVHQLQINFLVQHCEEFVLENISVETMDAIKRQADFLQANKVSEKILQQMLENFSTFRKTEAFLRLDFDDILKLIENDQLVVSSEDCVLFSGYDWVNYGDLTTPKRQEIDKSAMEKNVQTLAKKDAEGVTHGLVEDSADRETEKDGTLMSDQIQSNERKKYLLQLLKATRYCLGSESCIKKLFWNKLTQSNTEVKNVLFETSVFKISSNLTGFWPNAGIHRDCSYLEHVGITSGQLYGCTSDEYESEVYHFLNNKWVSVFRSYNKIDLFLSHEKCIYAISPENSNFERFQPHNPMATFEYLNHSMGNAEYAMSFYQYILFFETLQNSSAVKTLVIGWDPEKNAWTRLADLDFSADDMTSFSDELYGYVIDRFGNLYRVENSETVQFTFIEKLWNAYPVLKGAVLFKETLFLCGFFPQNLEHKRKVKNNFSIELLSLEVSLFRRSNFLHFLLPKTLLNQPNCAFSQTD